MRRIVRRIAEDTGAAIAPTVALTLFALIAAGGIAFDYARVASMDSELQNAADQAALAAASQLDGQANACVRAAAAANALLTNNTLMANEPGAVGMQVVIPTSAVTDCAGNANIKFYSSYNQVTDVPTPAIGLAAGQDGIARVVSVSVTPRESFFALTPIVAAFRSGNIGAHAVASLGSAICRVPPLMMCNPDETNDINFTVANYVGKGMRLAQAGNGAWAPGNFGFLDHLGGSNGDPGLREDLGWNIPPGECQPGDGVDTKPGVNAVDSAINSRFDIYDNQACINGGFCPPSINSVKDLVRDPGANGGNACKIHNQGWHEVSSGAYLPSDPINALPTTTTPTAMGHPRDMCHAVSTNGMAPCHGNQLRFGDGNWDRDAYFRVNYRRSNGTYWTGGTGTGTWQGNTGLSATATRWQVYNWEIANRGTTIDGVSVLGGRFAAAPDRDEDSPVCSASQGYGTGAIPSGNQVDRRKLVVAVANCSTADAGGQVNGNSPNVTVQKWIEVFLVEPSLDRARTSKKEIYVEPIGEAVAGGGAGPVIRRDVPYLLK
jgi:Flp pilus assembly protein TadG